jgi:tRNA(Phe) wybutosine-synthesizing methylase Tyw3
MKKVIKYKQIDPLIRPIIREFNKRGYITEFSCSGHKNGRRIEEGYISFLDKHNPNDIEKLARNLGLKAVKVIYRPPSYYKRLGQNYKNGVTLLTFRGLGGESRGI